MSVDLLKLLAKAHLNAGAPIVCVRTSDMPDFVRRATLVPGDDSPGTNMEDTLTVSDRFGDPAVPTFLEWDVSRGLGWRNQAGLAHCAKIAARPIPQTLAEQEELRDALAKSTGSLPELLRKARNWPLNTIWFVHNWQAVGSRIDYCQPVMNLRDVWKSPERMSMLVLLTAPGTPLDGLIKDATVILDEPLPDRGQLGDIVSQCEASAGIDPDDATAASESAAINAVSGLAAFPAETALAMSFVRRSGKAAIDIDGLWDRKRKMIAETPGLSVHGGKETLADLGGLYSIIDFGSKLLAGRRPPQIVFMTDEIEKQVGGGDGDTSGTTQMQVGKLLTWSQEKIDAPSPDGKTISLPRVTGLLLLGHPGAGKSAFAKALGNQFGTPTIIGDLGDTKNQYVGNSEARMAQMLQVVDAIGGGSVLWVATCNSVSALRPEFLSRFQMGTYFFDLPDAEERDAIWRVMLRKFGLLEQARPIDDGWVGREIESCCYKAWMLNLSLVEAGKYIVVGSQANLKKV